MVAANPFATLVLTYAVAAATGAGRSFVWQHVWEMLRNQGIATLLFAGAATLAVRRVHLRQRTTAARRRWRFAHLWRPGVGGNPMLWKEIFAEPAASRLGWVGWIVVTLIVVGVVGMTGYLFIEALATPTYGYFRPAEEYINYSIFFGTVLACGALLMVAARAAGSVVSERERDCWTSLLSTPLDPGEIIWAKIAGSTWSMRGALALLLLIWGLGVLLDPGVSRGGRVHAGHVPLADLLCRGAGRAVLAPLPHVAPRHGMHAGRPAERRRALLLLLRAADDVLRPWGPGDEMMLILTPCIPFLLAMPGGVYLEGGRMGPGGSEAGMMLFAYVLGVFGYLVAAFVLTRDAIAGFDSASGRTGPRMSSSLSAARRDLLAARGRTEPLMTRLPTEPPVVATLVDEPSEEAAIQPRSGGSQCPGR